MKISLNDYELGALAGLPHAVICLYVMAIRPRMNYATGMVGIKPFISWQALTEWLYIEPAPGVRGTQPSRWMVMRAAWQLSKAGLLRIASNVGNRQLIFECLLADTDKSAQNKAATKPQGEAALGRTRLGAGFEEKAARGSKAKAAIHPVTGLVLLPPPLAATDMSVEKPQGGGMDPGRGRPGQSSKTPPSLCWTWPKQLTTPERRTAQTLLKSVSDPQLMLDELQGAMSKRDIKQPLRYLARLIELEGQGTFAEELAHLARAQRASATQTRKSKAVSQEKSASPVPLSQEQIDRLPEPIRRRLMRIRRDAEDNAT